MFGPAVSKKPPNYKREEKMNSNFTLIEIKEQIKEYRKKYTERTEEMNLHNAILVNIYEILENEAIAREIEQTKIN